MFSTFSRTRVAGALIGAALATTVVAPGAIAQDLRSPDARDSSPTIEQPGAQAVSSYDDLRSPDASAGTRGVAPSEDQRSPDARDYPSPLVESQPLAVEAPIADGFDWLSAAIGAAAGTGLLVLLLAFGRAGRIGRRQRPVGA
jgi:hypothetical protein